MEHRVGGGGNLEERLIWLERGEGREEGKRRAGSHVGGG